MKRFIIAVVAVLAGIVPALTLAAPASASSTAPSGVQGVQFQQSGTSVTITWASPASWGTDYLGRPANPARYGDVYWVYLQSNYATSSSFYYKSCYTSAQSCTFTGLTMGDEYNVEIKAYNDNYSSSTTKSGPYFACCSVPDTPSGLQARLDGTTVTVSWNRPTNRGIGNDITYDAWSNVPGLQCTTKATSCQFTGLTIGTGYQFAVSAKNGAGSSRGSAGSNVVTPVSVPDPPTNVAVQVAKGGVAYVSWAAPTMFGGTPITRYVAATEPAGLACETAGETSCQITGLSNGTAYTVTLVAVNAVGSSAPSAASAPATPLAGPGKPGGVSVRPSTTSARVTWKPPASTGGLKITGYLVRAGERTCTSKKLTCTISGLQPGSSYSVSVQARNSKGLGEPAIKPMRTVGTSSGGSSTSTPAPLPSDKPEQSLS